MAAINFHNLQSEYQLLFSTCSIRPEKQALVNKTVDDITRGKDRYEAVANEFTNNLPWYFIGITHCMEASLKFNTHLHNGDKLDSRTVRVPKGRPIEGEPPFTWEFSARDALMLKNLHVWDDWSIAGVLFKLETYNGFGYRKLPQPIHTPYLWSCTNQYTSGKYVADHKYDPNAKSTQTGAAAIIKCMAERGIITDSGLISQLPGKRELTMDDIDKIKQLGLVVKYDPSHVVQTAVELQKLLKIAVPDLVVDGEAGKKTSDAFLKVTGNRLQGDSRGN